MSIKGQGHFLTLALCQELMIFFQKLSDDSNDIHGLILTYFVMYAFIWENVTMTNSLEIIASCDMEFN